MHFWEMAVYFPVVLLYAATYVLPPVLRRKAQEVLHGMFSASPPFDAQRTSVPYRDMLEAVRIHGP
jgi:hypothetical protein